MAAERKTKLSKNLLRMKFMQRGLDSETKKQLEEEEKKIIGEEHWYLDLPALTEKESFIIEEQSFLLCEDLLYGRMSFRGFNPEVEHTLTTLQPNCDNQKCFQTLPEVPCWAKSSPLTNHFSRMPEEINASDEC
ncbi:PREDICTED: M-phase phosphoprotein 6 isoform X2 [Propithecus coquereli]|uniref:M-phase phosphoprotein 6 isoform X2 n=1 Tax=Propithecus coquereli TaxID=379532 RepID=UPI00063F61FC|nr:PREDICTED: M-phase phosphoprotein 6 isoform X2 [Propithecus coquereli]